MQCVFVTYIVSLCVYPAITAWLVPAAAGGDAVLPFGVRLRGDLLVPFSFVVFNAVRPRSRPSLVRLGLWAPFAVACV